MKRLAILSIALLISGITFAQKRSTNPQESELNYKHPFAAAAAKKNKSNRTEQFVAEPATVQNDYKHPNRKQSGKLIRVRRGDGGNAAASTKHPLG